MDRDELVARISGEVVRRLALEDEPSTTFRGSGGTLVIVDTVNPGLGFTIQELSRLAKRENLALYLSATGESYFREAGLSPEKLAITVMRENEHARLVHTLPLYRDVVFPSPTVSFLKKLAALDDSDPCVAAAHQALLGGARLVVVSDALRPSKGREAGVPVGMRRAVDNALRAVAHQNVKVVGTKDLARLVGGGESSTRKRLITEKDILALKDSGALRLVVARGTIVTPSAKDKARELKIEIIEGKVEEESP